MILSFQKMHGLGNDFVLINNPLIEEAKLSKLAVDLCHRQTGIGGDGLVLVLPSEKADIRMRIFNSDGSEPGMCGNAIRCFARYVFENQLVTKTSFTVETLAGIMSPELILKDNKVELVKVDMGEPHLERAEIPMLGPSGMVLNEEIAIGNETYHISSLLMGVPHTMVYVENLDSMDIHSVGPQIEKHPVFPKGTNVNFVECINEKEVRMRTWERGAGATLACGTGSCATAVASALNGKTGRTVTVHLQLGNLLIDWTGEHVFMSGPATNVFAGTIEI